MGSPPTTRSLGDSKPGLVLCAKQAEKGLAAAAVGGRCPVHGGDACLYLFVTWKNVHPVIHAAAELVAQPFGQLKERDFYRLREAFPDAE